MSAMKEIWIERQELTAAFHMAEINSEMMPGAPAAAEELEKARKAIIDYKRAWGLDQYAGYRLDQMPLGTPPRTIQ